MRTPAQRLATGLLSASLLGLASGPSAQGATVPVPDATAKKPSTPPAAVLPDSAPQPATTPAPATLPAAPIDPAAPLDLGSSPPPHATEDLEQPKTTQPKPSKREPTMTGAKAEAKDEGAPAAPAPEPDPNAAAALQAMPAEAPADVPGYFIDSFRVPVFLLPIYQAAGIQYGVRWEVLAAINEIETDYGRNLNVSSAGALGWMQFMPATWQGYGVDANLDGRADPYNPVDAIFAAARYLQAAGAQADISKALFAYNHADWYVRSVLQRAQRLAALPNDLVGALTGLAQGRAPVLGKAAAVASRANVVAGRSRSLNLRVKDHAAAVAVTDGTVVRIGRNARLGRFVQLRDVYGNTYTYGGLASFARRYPVLRSPQAAAARAAAQQRPSAPGRKLAGRDLRAAIKLLSSLGKSAGTAKAKGASALGESGGGAKAQAATSLGASAGAASAKAGTSLGTTAGAANARTRTSLGESGGGAKAQGASSLGKSASAAPAGAASSLGSAASTQFGGPLAAIDWADRLPPPPATPPPARVQRPRPAVTTTGYDRHLLGGVAPERVAYRPLREGSRVVAGTILGHAASATTRAARVRFEIRPTGQRAPRIDPRPIVAGWKLLQASSPGTPAIDTTGAQTSVGQVLLLGKPALQRLVLANPKISLYPCGREDIRAGRVDRRVLATLQVLAMSGLSPTVSSLQCGHGRMTASGNVSEHWSGNAVDISAINGTPIAGHQGPGTITETTIRQLLTLQGTMRPHQIISLMTFDGAANTLALADHADHIHVGFAPLDAAASLNARLFDGVLQPKAWRRLIDRLAAIDNPQVAAAPSAAAIPAAPATTP